jgi:hypothetical protein
MHMCHVSHNDHKGSMHKQIGCYLPSAGTEQIHESLEMGEQFFRLGHGTTCYTVAFCNRGVVTLYFYPTEP